MFRPYLGQNKFLLSGAVFVPQYLKTAQAVLVVLFAVMYFWSRMIHENILYVLCNFFFYKTKF